MKNNVPESTKYLGCNVLSFLVGSLFCVLCDEIVLLDDVIARRLFKALLPRINVLFVRIAGFPALKIESPVNEGKKKKNLVIINVQYSIMHAHAGADSMESACWKIGL